MFLRYVFSVFAIVLLNSQCLVQAQYQPFECYSWGDPHIQTWHAKDDGQIHNRDCFANGKHTLVKNKYVDFEMEVQNTLTVGADVKFYDGHTNKVICHIQLQNFGKPTDPQCEKHGITVTTVTSGALSTHNIDYTAVNFFASIREIECLIREIDRGEIKESSTYRLILMSRRNSIIGLEKVPDFELKRSEGNYPYSCYYNIYVWQPQSLVDVSTGLCGLGYGGCVQRALGEDNVAWEPVRSGLRRQFITHEQAKSICHQYVDAFFVQTRRAPYQRNANLNSTVANVLAGCIDDVVFSGQIEMARSSIDVLMMKEITRDATSMDAIRTAVQSGIEAASATLDAAVKMAEVEVRKLI